LTLQAKRGMIPTMADITLREHLKNASKRQHEKYKDSFSGWGKLSVQKRTEGMTPEQKSEYFKNIRAGKKVTEI
jgi:ABC-type transporter MlaC component